MTTVPRPDTSLDWATSSPDSILLPPLAKRNLGWLAGEAPPAQFLNWWKNLAAKWVNYLDDQRLDAGGRLTALEANIVALQVREEKGRESIGVHRLKLLHTVTGSPLRALAFSQNNAAGTLAQVVAVGDNGAIVTRDMGDIFRAKTADQSYTAGFMDVVNGHAGWIAVGLGGQIQQSPEGSSWTTRKLNGSNLLAVAAARTGTFGQNGTYVAVGEAGAIWTSTNGTSWTQRTGALGSADLVAVEFAQGLFVVTSATGRVQTSPDGINWTARYQITGTSPRCLPCQLKYSAAQGFVSLYNRNGTQVGAIQSTDGINWTESTSSNTSGLGDEANLKMVLLDRQVVYLDIPTTTTASTSALLFDTPDMPSATGGRTLAGIADIIPHAAENVLGQLWVCGQDASGNGVVLAGARFRPNAVGA